MGCISPEGTLSPQARAILAALTPATKLEEASARTGLPLYRVRSSIRELVDAGLVTAAGALYETTEAGRGKLAAAQ
jgi:hypothetical protein